MTHPSLYTELDQRTRDVFVRVVQTYMETGREIGSRDLAKAIGVSAATVRNHMYDLEQMGWLRAPHVSAGRMPTEDGLKMYVEGVMQITELSAPERAALEAEFSAGGASNFFEQTGKMLSAISASAGLVVAPKADKPIRHIEFRKINEHEALAVIVQEGGTVENRLIDVPLGTTPDALLQASNFLQHHIAGRSLSKARSELLEKLKEQSDALDTTVRHVVEQGIATQAYDGTFIVRGASQLLSAEKIQELEALRLLMEELENSENAIKLLEKAREAQSVRIFIGAENPIFDKGGYSLILSPYHDASQNLLGAVGVIGPNSLNYAKIIPAMNVLTELMSKNYPDFSL